jgi:YrbI family 3-deoxy-D-manno-octulosonate 8-phosphate phosphatase
MSEVLAIIPARGGSKGIPRKNVLPLAGVPLIAHAIRAAQTADRVTRIVVSTDDDEIADVAREYGAEVVDRPADLSGDSAKSEDALLHVLETLAHDEGYHPALVVFLQCTSPLTLADDIDATIAALEDRGADSAVAVTAFHYFLWRHAGDGDAIGVNHDKRVRLMRQQREPEYLETGAVYVMKTDGFLQSRHRFFGRTAMHEIPSERVLEIDDPFDFTRAEERIAASQASPAKGAKPFLPREVRGLAMDFDGVHTDDLVLVDEKGREAVFCSRRDGMGIEMLRGAGLPMVVISKERVGIVAKRCTKLQIPCHHGEDEKLPKLQRWAADNGLAMGEIAYIGNDINDIACLEAAGIGVVPADAHPSALAAADIILSCSGGRGAIRELADLILEQRTEK